MKKTAHGIPLSATVESEMTLTKVLRLTLEALISLFGVVGNILVVIVISHLGKKKRPGDYYLQNLAIADLGTLIMTSPLLIIRLEMPLNWPFGEIACLYFYPVAEIFYGSSVWCIAVIAIERYRKMSSIEIYGRNRTPIQIAKRIAAVVWVISFLTLCFPLYFVVDYQALSNRGQFCGPIRWTHFLETVYIICLILLTYVIPLAIISFAYIEISRVLRQSINMTRPMKQAHHLAKSQSDKRDYLVNLSGVRLRQNIRAKKILSPLVVIFAVTMLPLNVFRLTMVFWPEFSEQIYFAHLLHAVVVSTIINSAANPVIYSVVSRNFGKRMLNHLLCRNCSFA